jgi:hypothetical protein
MAPKIAGRSVDLHRSFSAEDLRRVFDIAVCELHEADSAAKKRLRYRTPIFQRGGIMGVSHANSEERALRDAARALAQLWNV